MPSSKKEKIMFSILMSAFMVYGMEVYNKFLLEKSFGIHSFLLNPGELILLILIVIILETVIGGPLARKLAFTVIGDKKPGPLGTIVIMQICTVCMMCPMMSLVASIMFKCGFSTAIPSVWFQTVSMNILIALFWQLLVAGPCVRFLVLGNPARGTT